MEPTLSEMDDPEIEFYKDWRKEMASSSDDLSIDQNMSSNCSKDHELEKANEINVSQIEKSNVIMSENKLF